MGMVKSALARNVVVSSSTDVCETRSSVSMSKPHGDYTYNRTRYCPKAFYLAVHVLSDSGRHDDKLCAIEGRTCRPTSCVPSPEATLTSSQIGDPVPLIAGETPRLLP
ncbi:hypothetical protein AAFF_G00081350 [Aldrovandia affinis]|uniref:Uncharacterized protein n=1 Tax=Aldrovandia affinis TaxID=143900 RepID=A0AAD7T478_9TELE|nr:hypothetical protein AAFF_G00081350 [Aldrovandia affinis]